MLSNVPPDSLINSLNGQIYELPEVNRDKSHPAWKQ